MKSLCFCAFAATSAIYMQIANAAMSTCMQSFACSVGNCTVLNRASLNCISYHTTYYEPYGGIESCEICESGYARTERSLQLATACTATYYTCEEICNGCTNCVSDTSYSTVATGYESMVKRQCYCNTCSETYLFRCAAGYWGKSTNGTSGCKKCPTPGVSPAGATSATQCYVAAGVKMNDTTGVYVFTSAFYNSN